jgi:hypothetical protein
MRCFAHPETTAVGVCSICGRGVCEGCATDVGNRIACERRDCQTQARTMRGMTVASRPGPFLGVSGGLLAAIGIVLAVQDDDWVPLLLAGLGVVFIVMALIAERR